MLRKLTKQVLASFLAAIMILSCCPVGTMQTYAQETTETENKLSVDVDDAVSTTTGEAFKIQYFPQGSWTGTANHPEMFLNATEHYTAKDSEQCGYEMKFTGTGLAIYATIRNTHANCDVYIDGEYVGDLIAYTSGEKLNQQIVFEIDGLENTEHTMRVVKKSGESRALQLDLIRVFYDEVYATAITLDVESIRVGVGGSRQVTANVEPWLITPEVEWSSADESVATVDENGLIKAVSEVEAQTVVTAQVKGTDLSAQVAVTVDPTVKVVTVSVGDEKLLDTQEDYADFVDATPVLRWEGTAWKADTINSKIIVATKDTAVHNAEVTASDFVNEDGDVILAENISIKWLKEIEAYNGKGNKQGELLPYPDIIHKGGAVDIEAGILKFAWVSINIPEDAKAGTYTGTLSVKTDEMETPAELAYSVKVIDLVQPELNVTDIQIWQHPFSVANYYLGLGENINIGSVCKESANDFYFTEQHLNLMRAEMIEYASMGGHDLVATIVEEAWNHQSFYGDPSMIKWTKNADGTWTYDYTWFDTWVEFAIECGVIDPEIGLGQIKCYSVVPWGNYVTYYDEASDSTVKKAYTPGNDDWEEIWTPFLVDFMAHTKEKGWFDITYISMDERTLDQLEPTVELIESLSDENGEHFKISSCLNYSAPEYYDFTDHIDDISIGLKHTQVETSNALADHRRELGLKTTYYTCVGDYPSNFIISDPGDNYWNAWYTMTLGTDGYLRWAWDNFLYDMHGNVSYKSWEPGDCWFIYPVEREEVDMNGDCVAGFYSTPRYEMFKQGLRDVAKANYLMNQKEEYNTALDELTLTIERPQKGSLNGSATYANEAERALVHSDTDRMYDEMTVMAEEFAVELSEEMAALEDAIAKAQALTLSGYTMDSAAALAEALATAEAVSDNAEASFTEISEAVSALVYALDTMVPKKNVAYYADVTATYTKEDGTTAQCNQGNAYKITNGNTTDYWASEVSENGSTTYINAEDAEVVIELDGTYSVEDIVVVPYYKNGGRRYAYNVYISEDGKSWELVAEQKLYDEEGNLNPEGTSAGYTYTLEAAKTARYVKIEGTGVIHPNNATIKNLHLNEVMVYGVEIGNVAFDKPVTSSEYASTSRLNVHANDGDRATYWDAGDYANKPWIVVDLEGLYELDSINVINYFTKERYYQYEVYTSVDGEEYTLIGKKDTTENETAKGTDFIFEEPVRAAYIKIVGTYCSANAGFHLNEVRAFGKQVIDVNVEVGKTMTFYGPMGVEGYSRNEEVATVVVNDAEMTIQAVAEGTASIVFGDVIIDVLVTTDKEALRQALESAEALAENTYTVKSWKVFEEAKEAAAAVNENIYATAQDVTAAVDALTAAAGTLKEKVNVALNKPVTSSGNATTNRLDVHANDGDTVSYWDGGNYENRPWLVIDLEGTYEVDSINVVTYYKNARFYHYEVYTSVDGVEYTLVAEKTDRENSTEDGILYVFEEPVEAAYVKFVGTYNSANSGFHFNELSVYGELVAKQNKIRVACVGDSLTDGYKSSGGNKSDTAYPAYLQDLLGDKYKVGNFGMSSMTLLKDTDRSYWNTTEFTESLAFEPDVVIIMLGTNDSKEKYWNEEAFRADAIALVEEYKKLETNPTVIFAVSPHCFVEEGTDITAAGVDTMIAVQRALVEENGWETVDMYELTEGRESLYNADMVHFTDAGYYYVAQCMYSALTGEEMEDPTDSSRDIPVEVLNVTAGESQSGEGPERVLDGDSSTLWHTDWYGTSTENHWIQFELTEEYTVDGLRYQPRQNGKNGIITAYEIQVSADGEEWTSVADDTWAEDAMWKKVSFEGQDVKYVRLIAKEGYSGNAGYVFASAAEIRLTGEKYVEPVEPADPTDDSLDVPVEMYTATAGSTQSGNSTDAALDGNADSFWEAAWDIGNTNPELLWYQIELTEEIEIDAVRYLPRWGGNAGNVNGFITEYRIEVSTDGENWTTVAEGTWEQTEGWKNAEFEAVTAKYVRLTGVGTYADVGNNSNMSIAEIRVRATSVVTPPEPPVVVVDKEALSASIADAKAIDQELYTTETAAALADAIAAGEALVNDEAATQEAVDAAVEAIEAAKAALVEKEEPVDPPVEENDEVVRLYGAGRYETGYAVADALKEALGVEKFEAVVVATGKNFADALAGSYLAVEKNAPILLTNGKDDNVAELHAYIAANVVEGGKVYILGGEGAVPATVDAIDGYDVVRLFGDSRYDTNLEILAEAGVNGDSIIVATGKTFADSLSASAAKLPILLVKPNATLNDAQKAVLAGMKNIYIVGGEGAVSAEYEAELAAFGTVTRVYGDSRYDTSVEVAKTFCGDVDTAVVASGKNFPDGLCGGPLAAALNAPLVLTKDGGASAAAGYVAEKVIAGGFVLGGDGALTDATVVEVFGLESTAEIK